MFKEILLGSTLLTGYAARSIYSATRPAMTDVATPVRNAVGQSSVGSVGTVSSAELMRVANAEPMMAQFGNSFIAGVSAGPTCDTTPIFLTVTGVGTLTTNVNCTTADIVAVGGGEDGFGAGSGGVGGRGAGMGAANGVSVTSAGNKYQVGVHNTYAGTNTLANSFFCNTTANCGSLGASAVVAGGTGGRIVGSNIGGTTSGGGAGGPVYGGGGGAGGITGPGSAGLTGNFGGTGGHGGAADAGSGGAGGAGGTSGSHAGHAGSNGVDLGSSKGTGGGGGGSFGGSGGSTGGNGGLFGGGGGFGYDTGSQGVGAQGVIRVIFKP